MTTQTRPAAADTAAEPDPPEQLARSFKAAMTAVRRLRGRETQRPDALSFAQYGLLFSLADGCAMSARELADAATLTPSTVTQMLESLESHGLVRRLRSEADKRVVLTTLTERGQEVVAERRAIFESRWQHALSGFAPDELRTAAAVLDRLARHFEEL